MPEQAELFFGHGGSQRGDGGFEAGLVERDDIHVTFHQHQLAAGFEVGFGAVEIVELVAFVEEGGFGAVQIFRFGFIEHAAAEADHFCFGVMDGKDDAVAEPIVIATAGVLAFGGETGQFKSFRREAFGEESVFQVAPAFGCVAQLELGNRGRAKVAVLQVLQRGAAETALEEHGGAGEGFEAILPLGGGGGVVVFRLGQLETDLFGEALHHFHERAALVFLHEGDDVSRGAAAEAVVAALVFPHVETGGFFAVEGAVGPPIAALFLQRGANLAHFIGDAEAGFELIDDVGGVTHG